MSPWNIPAGPGKTSAKWPAPRVAFIQGGGSGLWPPGGLKGTMGVSDDDPLSFSSVLFLHLYGKGFDNRKLLHKEI